MLKVYLTLKRKDPFTFVIRKEWPKKIIGVYFDRNKKFCAYVVHKFFGIWLTECLANFLLKYCLFLSFKNACFSICICQILNKNQDISNNGASAFQRQDAKKENL